MKLQSVRVASAIHSNTRIHSHTQARHTHACCTCVYPWHAATHTHRCAMCIYMPPCTRELMRAQNTSLLRDVCMCVRTHVSRIDASHSELSLLFSEWVCSLSGALFETMKWKQPNVPNAQTKIVDPKLNKILFYSFFFVLKKRI